LQRAPQALALPPKTHPIFFELGGGGEEKPLQGVFFGGVKSKRERESAEREREKEK
jgi:hypothetical protein